MARKPRKLRQKYGPCTACGSYQHDRCFVIGTHATWGSCPNCRPGMIVKAKA
jgi:hypothetical protein